MTKRVTLTEISSTSPEGGTTIPTLEPEGQSVQFNINLFELGTLLLAKRKLIIGVTFVSVLATTVFMLLQPNQYTSHATILPSGKAISGSLNSVRSLVGLADPTPLTDENSSAIFPVILKSNLVADGVLAKTYTFTDHDKVQTLSLSKYFDEDNPDRLRKDLRDKTSVESNKLTAEIAVGVETSYPELSQQVVREYLRLLEDFNLNKRQSSAKSNCQYLSRQIELVGAELKTAEDQLEDFQMHNMAWSSHSDPEITKEIGRLQRNVDVKSTTYMSLSQQYETAKLDAQKDVPIVRILDAPSLPTVKSAPFRSHVVVLSALLSLGLICLLIIGLDIAKQSVSGANRGEFEAFRDTVRNSFPRTERLVNRLGARLTAAAMRDKSLQEQP